LDKKVGVGIVIVIVIGLGGVILGLSPQSDNIESADKITVDQIMKKYFVNHRVKVSTESAFDIYLTERDVTRIQQNLPAPVDGIKISLIEQNSEIYEDLKPNDKTIVIYPIFTSAAYKQPGFYTYFGGECDETCITVNFENPQLIYTSSGMATQVLYALGYDFITDIDVDKNPEILQNFDKLILLHNEYVTKKAFEAISTHPNVIFLYPNALYAEVEVDYVDKTITLIRGHGYPEKQIKNGFDYEIEEQFHEYEYDSECLEWEFIEIENGYHLNCYPDPVIRTELGIIWTMKDLLGN